MIFGYARVSTSDQSTDVQTEILLNNGVEQENLIKEVVSGVKSNREGIKELKMRANRKGDIIIITKLDRLGRSTRELLELIEYFTEKGVTLKFLSDGISTDQATSKLILTILGAIAEAERVRIKERQREGIDFAQKKGVKFGRKKIAGEKILELYNQGIKIKNIEEKCKVSQSTIFRILREAGVKRRNDK